MRSVEEVRLTWKENTACLRGREGTRRRSRIQERGPFQVNICDLVVVVVPTMSIIVYYYCFKKESTKLNYGVASLKGVHSLLDKSEMVN